MIDILSVRGYELAVRIHKHSLASAKSFVYESSRKAGR
jgi:hypothetical protein